MNHDTLITKQKKYVLFLKKSNRKYNLLFSSLNFHLTLLYLKAKFQYLSVSQTFKFQSILVSLTTSAVLGQLSGTLKWSEIWLSGTSNGTKFYCWGHRKGGQLAKSPNMPCRKKSNYICGSYDHLWAVVENFETNVHYYSLRNLFCNCPSGLLSFVNGSNNPLKKVSKNAFLSIKSQKLLTNHGIGMSFNILNFQNMIVN